MVMTNVAVPVPLELVALMVTLYVPAVVGVPEINPAFPPFVLTVKPGGNPVAPYLLMGSCIDDGAGKATTLYSLGLIRRYWLGLLADVI